MSSPINMEIGGIGLSITCRDLALVQDDDPAYKSFFRTERHPLAIDVKIDLDENNMPDTSGLTKLFDTDQSWSLFQDRDDCFVVLNPPGLNGQPIWVAQFDCGFSRVTVWCSKILMNNNNGRTLSNPVTYPLDQILLMYALAQRQGAVVHAAGIGIDGKGCLFPGRSGAGKSTLSRQFAARNCPMLLSDDRMVIRKIDETYMAFGTPWPGEEGIALNESVPLAGIFFIAHGDVNRIREIGKQEAFERLLPVTSIPWYDEPIMNKILDFCDEVSSNIPAFELHFKPGFEVVDVLEEFASAWSDKSCLRA